MSRPVHSLPKKCKIKEITVALQDTSYNGFPIVENNQNGDSRLVGLISRHTLLVIMKNIDKVPDCEGRLNIVPDNPEDQSLD